MPATQLLPLVKMAASRTADRFRNTQRAFQCLYSSMVLCYAITNTILNIIDNFMAIFVELDIDFC